MQFSSLKIRLFVSCVFAFSVCTAGAIDQLYVNSVSVTNPVVNAYGFLNNGYFRALTDFPYETANTLNYTNRGTMEGSVGFRFNYFAGGFRRFANHFENETDISADDGTTFNFNGTSSFGSYIYVKATNVVNPGSLSVGSAGLLRVDAVKANFRGGALLAGQSVLDGTFGFLDDYSDTNYFNETKVSDLYWGVGTNGVVKGAGNRLFLSQLTNQFPSSGLHQVVETSSGFRFTNTVTVPSFNGGFTNVGYQAHAYVHPTYTSESATGRVIQVVYVYTNNANGPMNSEVKFRSNGFGTEVGAQVLVKLSVEDVDVITGLPLTNAVYFSDNSSLATSGTNLLFLQKNASGSTFRPNPYDLTFGTPFEWNFASVSNVQYTPSLIHNPNYASQSVSNVYSGYSVYVGSSLLSTNTGLDPLIYEPTNSVGRVEIYADRLDLNLARIRSEGLLTLSTPNLAPVTEGARMDAQQINLTLGTTNQQLVLSNFLSGSVRRLNGQINAWSGVWTNHTAAGQVDVFHILILDNQLTSVQTTTAYGFIARATNQPNGSVILCDPISVSRNLLIDAENLTLKNDLTVTADIGATNWPRLLNFTNEGQFVIPGNASFVGNSGALVSFVNRSNIVANGGSINSLYFENSGIIGTRVGSLTITNSLGNANLSSGQLISAIDLNIVASEIVTSNSTIRAGEIETNFQGQATYRLGGITVSADHLTELGQSNDWRCLNGFRLFKLSAGGWDGDLIGTRLQSTVKPAGNVSHIWSGTDFGVAAAGFTNNAAIGRVVLDGGSNSRFRFGPQIAGSISAIYIDYLDLQNFATNFQTALDIDPFFRIYFAGSSVPAEKLDNTHGGRLRWVKEFAGPNSSVDVVVNGQTVKMNRALVESKEIDSDGDSIPNGFDPSPFDGVVISHTAFITPASIGITWAGAANVTYNVYYTSELSGTNTVWTYLRSIATGDESANLTIEEQISSEPRFYQIRYNP